MTTETETGLTPERVEERLGDVVSYLRDRREVEDQWARPDMHALTCLDAIATIAKLRAEVEESVPLTEALGHKERARILEATLEQRDAALRANREAMALFASVIQSGEPWTPYCREALHRANESVRAIADTTDTGGE